MEYYNNVLCVSGSELTDGDDAVMSVSSLRAMVSRRSVAVARRGGGRGVYALYVYSSLTSRIREDFERKYGSPIDYMRRIRLRGLVRESETARRTLRGYTYLLGGRQVHLSRDLFREYLTNANVIEALMRMADEMATEAKMRGNRKRDVWDQLLAVSEDLRSEVGHTLPASIVRLKARLKAYERTGAVSCVSAKLGNSNTAKMTHEGVTLLVALKRCKRPVYSDSEMLAEYNRRALEMGMKGISMRSMQMRLKSPEVQPLWWDAVYGEQSARVRFDRRHVTMLPTLRDALWYGDGTKLNLYYRDESGKMSTTMVYEVIDAASEMLLGYCISDTEDYKAQYSAFRMAVRRAGHKPYEVVTDNQGGQKKAVLKDFFHKIAVVHRPTAPYNGRSKTIENIFYRFQKDVLHKHWNFTGQNITAKKETSRPNMEFIRANVENLPTLAEVMEIYAKCREEWNDMRHPKMDCSRREAYEKSVNELSPAVGVDEMVEMFWAKTQKPVMFTASGVKITVRGVDYMYEVLDESGAPDMEWRAKHTYEKFYVMYDPMDMSSARLITRDGRFERVASPVVRIHRAQQDQSAEEKAFIRLQREANDVMRCERNVSAREASNAYGMGAEMVGLNEPTMLGASKALREQVDARTNRLRLAPIRQKMARRSDLGKWTKAVSGQTWDEDESISEKRMASKL